MTRSDKPERQALRRAFLEAMSFTASTVSVVTTGGPAGRAGVTVSAMSSVSADTPRPSLLVCLHTEGRATPLILQNRVFCVNVLRDDQTAISDLFAGRIEAPGGDRFANADWVTGPTGAPRVVSPLVAFDCRLTDATRMGTHQVIFGAVEDIYIAGGFIESGGSPLIYNRRAYGRAAALA
jgi:flavin reductase